MDSVRPPPRDQEREKWVHEDDLISQRLQWYGVSQALLFAAYGLSFQVRQEDLAKSEQAKGLFLRFIDAVPIVGVLLSLIIFIGVLAACAAMIIMYLQREKPRGPLGVHWTTSLMGMSTGLLIPALFFWLWAHVMLDLGSIWPWNMRLWFQDAPAALAPAATGG